MAYLGQGPFQEFTNPPTKDSFTGDGSTTAFDMAAEVASSAQNALEVYVDNVRQEPGTGKAFTLGPDGDNDTKRITFSAAPANGASIYVINDKTNISITAPLNNDLNGTELILDGDGDTSITADTDDRIDFRLAAADHFHIGTSSGDTVFQNRTDAKDFKFNQYDGRTILEINDAGYVALANGATGPGQLRIYEDTDLGTNFSAFQVGTQSADITYTLPTADGTSDFKLTTNASGVLSWTASHLPTSADGQALGSATLEWSDLFLADGGVINLGADQDTTLTHVADTGILLNSTRQLQFGDSGTYIHQSADGVLDLVSDTEIELNATTLDINANVQISGTTTIVGNLILGSASLNEASLEILDGATVTTTELNIIDGGTSATATTVADADRVVFNDGGTMKQVAVTDLAAYFDDEITAMPNLVTTAATTVGVLGSGSIAAGFGAIDNGASNITTGGLVSLDVDADADDVSGDSATGRLTLGAGQDLNLYHGGTNSYIVNDTGDLILKTGASDEDMIFQGNDGGSPVTALTLDMSAAGAATFNSTVAAAGFLIGSATVTEAQLEILDGATVTTTELNLIDGGTARGTTAVASGDGILINDAGTMAMTNVDTVSTYFASHSVGGGNIVTTGALGAGSIAAGFGAIDNGTSGIRTNTVTVETSLVPAANDGADIGTTSLGFNDMFFADSGRIVFGDDQDTTLTHTDGSGLTLNSTNKLMFGDTGTYIFQSADGVLDLVSDTEIELNATTLDINANVEISGTATTTGVHTFTAIPVLPANTIDSDMYVDGSIDTAHIAADQITNAKIADDQIDSEHYVDGSIDHVHLAADCIDGDNLADNAVDSEHYTDGSIDTAHIADLNVTGAKLALDRRSAASTNDVKMGNQHDYIFADADVGLSFFTANAEDMRLTDAGALHVDDDIIAFSSTISDERLKDNIAIVDDALNKVEQLKGVTFTYKENGKNSAGVIAQDVQKVLPCAVTSRELPLHGEDDGEEYLTVNYDALNALLIESIKELSAALQKATTRIETLENR